MSNDIIKEISALLQQPNAKNDPKLRAEALRLSRLLVQALQKPEDAALELALSVGCSVHN
jgi:hypothetical protein